MNQQNVGPKRSASPTAGKIAAKSHEATEQWKDAVVDQANQVRDKAASAKEHTTDRIRGVASQLQNMSDTLRDEDPLVASIAERASRSVESVARYVGSSSARTFLSDTEQLARRQPALFFGGAFLLGLAAGRFLKSSAPQGRHDHHDRYADRDDEAQPGQLSADRDARGSGFFPPERSVRSNQPYQEKYDAAFGGHAENQERPVASDLDPLKTGGSLGSTRRGPERAPNGERMADQTAVKGSST